VKQIIAIIALVSAAAAIVSGAQTPAKPQQHGRLFPPTDLGLLELPDRDLWQLPEQIMDALGIAEASVVADVGAGSGWFPVRLARRVGPNGVVFAQDVLGSGSDPRLPRNTLDAIVLVGVYNEIRDKITMLRNLAAALKPQGRIGVIDFKMLPAGGPGPAIEERVDPKIVVRDAAAAHLQLQSQETFLPYQYFLIFSKAAATTSKPTAAPRSPARP
jgi:hypothetical protein